MDRNPDEVKDMKKTQEYSNQYVNGWMLVINRDLTTNPCWIETYHVLNSFDIKQNRHEQTTAVHPLAPLLGQCSTDVRRDFVTEFSYELCLYV